MASLVDALLGAVIGLICVLVWVYVYAAIPSTNLSTEVKALLSVIPIVMAAAILLGIVVMAFGRR